MSLCMPHPLKAPTAIDATMVEAFYVATFPSVINFVKRNGGRLEEIESFFHRDKFLNAMEARNFGLIDKV